MAKWKKIVIIALVLIIIVQLPYWVYFAYWGRRHSILWDVQQVRVVQDDENENSVILIYDVTYKNWPHDFKSHDYYLTAYLTGEPSTWMFDVIGNSDEFPQAYYFTCTHQTTSASFGVRYGIMAADRYDGAQTNQDAIEEAIEISRFMPWYMVDGEAFQRENGMLYMEDSPDAKIIYEVDTDFLSQKLL